MSSLIFITTHQQNPQHPLAENNMIEMTLGISSQITEAKQQAKHVTFKT